MSHFSNFKLIGKFLFWQISPSQILLLFLVQSCAKDCLGSVSFFLFCSLVCRLMGWAVGYSPPPGYAGLYTVDNQLLIKYSVQLAISVQHDQEKASFLQRSLLHDFGSICTITSIVYNCNYILFTKLPWPGDSEGIFRSSSQAATCPSVYHTRWRLHIVPLIAERQAGKLWIPIFIVFGLTQPGIKPVSTVSVADALSTRPLIGFYPLVTLMCFWIKRFTMIFSA